jgi:hypothetical protein
MAVRVFIGVLSGVGLDEVVFVMSSDDGVFDERGSVVGRLVVVGPGWSAGEVSWLLVSFVVITVVGVGLGLVIEFSLGEFGVRFGAFGCVDIFSVRHWGFCDTLLFFILFTLFLELGIWQNFIK